MHDAALNDAISDSLPYDVLGVFFRVEVELDTDVAQGDAGVGEGEMPDPGLDDVLAEAEDKAVGLVGFEGGRVAG